MKSVQTNLKKAILDIAKELEGVFKKYSLSTRKKAWSKITSKKGEEEIKKILINPKKQLNTFEKLANESFVDWLSKRE